MPFLINLISNLNKILLMLLLSMLYLIKKTSIHCFLSTCKIKFSFCEWLLKWSYFLKLHFSRIDQYKVQTPDLYDVTQERNAKQVSIFTISFLGNFAFKTLKPSPDFECTKSVKVKLTTYISFS